VFPEPSTTYQIKSHSLVAVAVVAASAVSLWGATSRRWHVPRCGSAAGSLLSGGGGDVSA
jgi:hypothetical protein